MSERQTFAAPGAAVNAVRTVCLHGPESTGKSTLAAALAARYRAPLVSEYGRTHCELYGTELTMDDLVTIGETHAAMTATARARADRLLILDTDPLMTAVWADMLFGARDPWFAVFDDVADLYLVPALDLPWVEDGTRMFGHEADRRRFYDLSVAELERRGLPWVSIAGSGAERLRAAVAAIERAGLAD